MKNSNNCERGFTLAEVLITLGIIGVIAALTLPSVVGKYKEKAVVSQLKKSYSTLSQALLMAIADNGDPEGWGASTYNYETSSGESKEILITNLDLIVKYLNVIRDCGHETKGCMPDDYLMLNGAKERNFEKLSYYRKVVLEDGTLLAMQGYGTDNPGRGEIWVDVNGHKKPNKVGEDMFLFGVDKSKVYPYGLDSNLSSEEIKKQCNRKGSGYYCTLWVITDENQKYL